jgi:penicillin amidase
LDDPESGWWDDPQTPLRESRDIRLSQIGPDVCRKLEGQFGGDPDNWRWGDVHQGNFISPILGQSGIGLLEKAANRQNVALAGGAATVSVARWKHGTGYAPIHIAGYRMIFDWSDPDRIHMINSMGQSSHVGSPHYSDQLEQWAANQYRVVDMSEQSIRERAKHRQTLRAENPEK